MLIEFSPILIGQLHTCQVSRFQRESHASRHQLTPIILTPTQKSTNWKISVNMSKLPQQNWFTKNEIRIC